MLQHGSPNLKEDVKYWLPTVSPHPQVQLILTIIWFIVFLQIHKQNIHMDFSIVSRTNLETSNKKKND